MKKILLIVLMTINCLGFSQVTSTIPTFTATGASFAILYNSGQLQGTLTGVGVNATLSAQTGDTWANDLTIIVMPTNTLTGTPLLQVGGDSNFGATEKGVWPNGGSNTIGTVVNGVYTLTTPVNFTANPLYSMRIGNGYANGTNSGTWTGVTITLNGITAVLSTDEVSKISADDISVYPNPATDFIKIKNKDSDKIEMIGIMDATGKSIRSVIPAKSGNEIVINISDLTNGTYILIISTEKGKTSKKFIKK